MANPDIINYIKQARTAGDSDDKIKTDLISTGWDSTAIDEGIAEVSGAPAPVATPTSEQPATPSQPAAEPAQPVDSTKTGFGYYIKSAFRIAFFNSQSMREIAANQGAMVWSFVFSLPWGILGLLIPSSILALIAKIFRGKGKAMDFFKVVSFGSIALLIIFVPIILLFGLLGTLISTGGSVIGLFIYLGAVGILSIWAFILYVMIIKNVFNFGYVRAVIVMLIPYVIFGILIGAMVYFLTLSPVPLPIGP